MGCCFSCFNSSENKSQSGEPNERTTLLGNPVSNSISRPLFSQDFSTEAIASHLGDEQAALSKILHQTTIDIIDVSAIPTHIEQKDYIDRVKLYQRRLITMQLQHAKNDKFCLVKDLPLPEKILSENPICLADFQVMNDSFTEVQQAVKTINVEPIGDLVTQFN